MSSGWNGLDYRPLFSTPEQIRIVLDQIPVGVLIIDRQPSPGMRPHERTLRRLVVMYRDDWDVIYSGSDITIYLRKSDLSQHPIHIEVDLKRTLGGPLLTSP